MSTISTTDTPYSVSQMAANLADSTMKICYPGDKEIIADEIMIYGYQHCEYRLIYTILKSSAISKKIAFTEILDWSAGDPEAAAGESIVKIPIKKSSSSSKYKAGLVNIVFENYKRKREGKPIIHILFCLAHCKESYPLTPENLTSKEESANKLITHKEIRRAYKLCKFLGGIGKIAEETFKFVKVNEGLRLEQIPAPWQHKDWDDHWEKRLSKIKTSSDEPSPNAYSWRKELAILKADFDKKPFILKSLQT